MFDPKKPASPLGELARLVFGQSGGQSGGRKPTASPGQKAGKGCNCYGKSVRPSRLPRLPR